MTFGREHAEPCGIDIQGRDRRREDMCDESISTLKLAGARRHHLPYDVLDSGGEVVTVHGFPMD